VEDEISTNEVNKTIWENGQKNVSDGSEGVM